MFKGEINGNVMVSTNKRPLLWGSDEVLLRKACSCLIGRRKELFIYLVLGEANEGAQCSLAGHGFKQSFINKLTGRLAWIHSSEVYCAGLILTCAATIKQGWNSNPSLARFLRASFHRVSPVRSHPCLLTPSPSSQARLLTSISQNKASLVQEVGKQTAL